MLIDMSLFFFFSSRRRHTRCSRDWSSDVCSSDSLNHRDGEAEKFYRELKQRGVSVRVGLEATGYSRWFERLLAELGFEVWIGDAAEIKRSEEHTSELQSRLHLVCRLLLVKMNYRQRSL